MPPTRGITEAASQAQMDTLREEMKSGFAKMEELITRYEERLRGLEQREAGCQPLMVSRLDAAWKKIDSHDARMSALSDDLQKMAETARFLETVAKWLLGIVTAMIIAIAVAALTGRIYIVVR